MKLTYNNQTIDLFGREYFPDGPPDRIAIGVSGGLDSASILFLLCKHFPNIKKFIYTGKDVVTPFDSEAAIDVVSWCKNNFPDHNILSHDVIVYDDRDPEVLKEIRGWVEEDSSWYDKYAWIDFPGNPEKSMNHFLGKIAKPYLTYEAITKVMEDNLCTKYIAAMTQNPPNKVMEQMNFAHLAETKRNEDREDVKIFGNRFYHPLARVNKLFVQGVFEQENLMDSYYHLTGSCTGTANETNFFMEPCKECFWCNEKMWAFGKY